MAVKDPDEAQEGYTDGWYGSYQEWQTNATDAQDTYQNNVGTFLQKLQNEGFIEEANDENVDGQEFVNGVEGVSQDEWTDNERDFTKWAERYNNSAGRGEM